ncbi:hypothetical protein N7491_010392 [Penicillium cf. griseofulvum]|nr:hypothetical protein N7491_010392 [Penicillium cf. griseofulvum]
MSDSFTSSSYYYSSTTNGSDGKTTTGHSSTPNVLADIGGSAAQLLDGAGEDDSFNMASSALGSRVYDPVTGTYNDQSEYDIGGVTRHHRGMRDAGGRRLGRDVDFAGDGLSSTARENRRYEDPSTGTRLRRESDVDVRNIL